MHEHSRRNFLSDSRSGRKIRARLWAALLGAVATATAAPSLQAVETKHAQAEATGIWEYPSSAIRFSRPLDTVYDPVGDLLFIADTGNRRIRAFDTNGMHVRSYVHRVATPRGMQEGEPTDLAVSANGFMYVLDALTPYVDVLDLMGTRVREIHPRALEGYPGDPADDSAARPSAITLDAQGRLVVAVGAEHCRVLGLNETATAVDWTLDGSEGGGARFGAITSLAIDRTGRIYVADATGLPAVRVYSSERAPLFGFGNHEIGNENFSLPLGVAVTDDGRIWVVDSIRQTVKVFDAEGSLLGMVGAGGTGIGDLLYPSSVATDGKENLYVLERVGARLSTFRINELAAVVTP